MSAVPAAVPVLLMPCSEGPAAVPSHVVHCRICECECWISKRTGWQTRALAAKIARDEGLPGWYYCCSPCAEEMWSQGGSNP